jgi:hypothetical protein
LHGLLIGVCLFTGQARATEREDFRYFVTPADEQAMQWITTHTPADARFAINTYFWLPNAPQGTDAGYWIPYFTGRQTTAGVMLNSLSWPTSNYLVDVVTWSQAVKQLEQSDALLEPLYRAHIRYVYIGARGNFADAGLNIAHLSQFTRLQIRYQQAGVTIFEVMSK